MSRSPRSEEIMHGFLETYLTRSARVNGLRGLAASLLISSSGICAVEGGCDHPWTGGKVAVDMLRQLPRRRASPIRLARFPEDDIAATRPHI